MILESSPLTKELHNYRRKKICMQFPIFNTCRYDYYLSLWKYLNHIPERFYSRKAYEDIWKHLANLLNEPNTLVRIFKDIDRPLSLSFKSLNEINSLKFHDSEFPNEDLDLMQFCDNFIHPNYLNLIEGVYSNLIFPISAYQRIRRNVKLNNFDLYNRVQELKETKYEYLSRSYDNTIRNAIAHGKVMYKQVVIPEVIFQDKKNSRILSVMEFINIFDNLIDICNGLSLGFRLFYLMNLEFLEKYGVNIPLPIMIEELQAQVDAPGWEIKGCIESKTIENKNQLTIYIKNKCLDSLKVYYYVYRSGILAEKLVSGYQRYFFTLHSKYSLLSWAAFDGSKLHELRIKNTSDLQDYVGALEDKTIVFTPKIKLPRLIFQIVGLFFIARIILPIKKLEFKEAMESLSIVPRETRIHRNGFYSIIRSSVVVKSNSKISIYDLTRGHCNTIVKKTIKSARKKLNFYNILKYLGVGYIRVGIFTQDFRIRKLTNSGLIPELICTIEFKRLLRIRTIDIRGGKVEMVGKFRVVWNQNPRICNDIESK